jgi:hypothetical protein
MSAPSPSAAGQGIRWSLARVARWAHAIRSWQRERRCTESELRGIKLLREWLSPVQLAQFDRYGYFDVVGCDSGKTYRICYRCGTNIYELDRDGRRKVGWCFVPVDTLVAGDVVLAQKIALETSERRALAVARNFMPSWH